jgi:hypothetical protein
MHVTRGSVPWKPKFYAPLKIVPIKEVTFQSENLAQFQHPLTGASLPLPSPPLVYPQSRRVYYAIHYLSPRHFFLYSAFIYPLYIDHTSYTSRLQHGAYILQIAWRSHLFVFSNWLEYFELSLGSCFREIEYKHADSYQHHYRGVEAFIGDWLSVAVKLAILSLFLFAACRELLFNCCKCYQCKIWGFHGSDYEEWRLLGR